MNSNYNERLVCFPFIPSVFVSHILQLSCLVNICSGLFTLLREITLL